MEGDFFGWWLVGANLSLEWGREYMGDAGREDWHVLSASVPEW